MNGGVDVLLVGLVLLDGSKLAGCRHGTRVRSSIPELRFEIRLLRDGLLLWSGMARAEVF